MKTAFYTLIVFFAAASAASAQQHYAPYAEDVLRAERMEQLAAQRGGCAEVEMAGKTLWSAEEAAAVLCMAAQRLPLALSVWEYGCTDRSELIIGALLQAGVPVAALGRVSTYFDRERNSGGRDVFVLEDAAHDRAFRDTWRITFGDDYPRQLRLLKGERELLLDMRGRIRWNIGHIAPTLWVHGRDGGAPELRVLDVVLSPDAPLEIEQWRQLQNAQDAAVLWGAVDNPPDILAEYLPPPMLTLLKRAMGMAPSQDIDVAYTNRVLRESNHETKTQLYARVLDIPQGADWHPQHWRGYSFTGELRDRTGNSLPPWREGDAQGVAQRMQAAQDNLALLTAYHEMRAGFANDEEFLQEVRDRMGRQKRNDKVVTIRFDED